MLSRPGAAAEHAMRNATNLETESMMMGRRKPILIDLKGAKPLPQYMVHKVMSTMLQAKKEADELEKVREAVQSEMGERTMEHGRVCMAADNLFHRCRGRSAVKYKRTADPVEQLGVIGDYVHDLDKIVKQHGRENPGLLD